MIRKPTFLEHGKVFSQSPSQGTTHQEVLEKPQQFETLDGIMKQKEMITSFSRPVLGSHVRDDHRPITGKGGITTASKPFDDALKIRRSRSAETDL